MRKIFLVAVFFVSLLFSASPKWQKISGSNVNFSLYYLSDIFKDGGISLDVNRLTISSPAATNKTYHIASNGAVSSGKKYFEVTVVSGSAGLSFGLSKTQTITALSDWFCQAGMYGYQSGGWKRIDSVPTSAGVGFSTGDILGCAYDADSGGMAFYKNGTLVWTYAVPANTPLWAVLCIGATNADILTINFSGSFGYLPNGFTAWNAQ